MDKKLQFRRALMVLIALAVIMIIGFFVSNWIRFNGSQVEYSQLIGSYFADNRVVEIKDDTVVFYTDAGSEAFNVDSYTDNVLSVSTPTQVLTFTVLDKNALYCSERNLYLHRGRV